MCWFQVKGIHATQLATNPTHTRPISFILFEPSNKSVGNFMCWLIHGLDKTKVQIELSFLLFLDKDYNVTPR